MNCKDFILWETLGWTIDLTQNDISYIILSIGHSKNFLGVVMGHMDQNHYILFPDASVITIVYDPAVT